MLDRPRPEWAPLGIHVGGFTVFPKVDSGLGYVSNVFATPSDVHGDGYIAIDPTIYAQSNWSRDGLSGSVGAHIRQFFTYRSENEDGWFANLDGRLDVVGDSYITAGASVRKAYEEQDEGDYPIGAIAPVGYVQDQSYLRGFFEQGRIRLVGAADYNHLSFGDVLAQGGGELDQSSQDQSISRFTGRGEFGLTPDQSVFSQFTYTTSSYDHDLAGGLQNRSSQEARAVFGASFDITAVSRGELALGYIQRDYASPAFKNLAGLAVDAKVEYFPTQLVTLTLRGYRLVQDSIFLNSGGFFNNTIILRADYELLRNLLLDAQGSYNLDQFEGVDRIDRVTEFQFGAHYLLSHTLGVKGDLVYIDRNSSGSLPGPRFSDFRAVLTLTVQR